MADRSAPFLGEIPKWPFGNLPGAGPMAADPVRDAEDEASRQARARRELAKAVALRELADIRCPEDLKEWGRRHNIPTFAEMTWQAGFMAGYAAGLARLDLERGEEAPR